MALIGPLVKLDVFENGCRKIALSGRHSYVASISGLHLVDISNPAHPRRVGGNTVFAANDVTAGATHTFAMSAEGLWVFPTFRSFQLHLQRSSHGVFELRAQHAPATFGRVQRSIDLETWTDYGHLNELFSVDPRSAPEPKAFYRAISP